MLDELSPLLKLLAGAGGAAGLMFSAWYLTRLDLNKFTKAGDARWEAHMKSEREKWDAIRADDTKRWEQRAAQEATERNRQYMLFEKQMDSLQAQTGLLATIGAELRSVAAVQQQTVQAIQAQGQGIVNAMGTIHNRIDNALAAK